jgi:hypothetical protein
MHQFLTMQNNSFIKKVILILLEKLQELTSKEWNIIYSRESIVIELIEDFPELKIILHSGYYYIQGNNLNLFEQLENEQHIKYFIQDIERSINIEILCKKYNCDRRTLCQILSNKK